MPRLLYSVALWLLLPGAILQFLWRSRSDRGGLKDVLVLGIAPRSDRPLWLHAASVGEVQALAAVVAELAKRGVPLLLTVRTATGVAHARRLHAELLQAGSAVQPPLTVRLAPWDLPDACARFLAATRPRAAVFVETELWPNLVAASQRADVPLLLVSARLSAHSLRRYQRWASQLMRNTVRSLAAIEAQTTADRERFIALGADGERVVVGGNLKFDLPLPDAVVEQGARLRVTWAPDRALWVAGSTHREEECACIEAHRALLARARSTGGLLPLLVLAPRRPERFDEVAHWLGTTGLRCLRISSRDCQVANGDGAEVLLLDRMGELLGWYAAADVAFVGGSMVPVGGHNLLEPAALGKPVIAGPHCFNSPQAAELLAAADALITVSDSTGLVQALQSLFDDPAAHARGTRAAAVVAANRGAAQRALAAIARLPQRADVKASA